MLLTLSTTHRGATDLGFLLHKNPARPQVKELSFGAAHVFYPEAEDGRCTAALLLEIDPISLIRGRPGRGSQSSPSFSLGQYVNDRPYAASSFLSVAIAQVYGSALSGRSKERPDLAAMPIPLTATIAAVPCRGGEAFLRRLFEPLGYAVTAERHPLDERFPEWGEPSNPPANTAQAGLDGGGLLITVLTLSRRFVPFSAVRCQPVRKRRNPGNHHLSGSFRGFS